jgi:hypothetical protein
MAHSPNVEEDANVALYSNHSLISLCCRQLGPISFVLLFDCPLRNHRLGSISVCRKQKMNTKEEMLMIPQERKKDECSTI